MTNMLHLSVRIDLQSTDWSDNIGKLYAEWFTLTPNWHVLTAEEQYLLLNNLLVSQYIRPTTYKAFSDMHFEFAGMQIMEDNTLWKSTTSFSMPADVITITWDAHYDITDLGRHGKNCIVQLKNFKLEGAYDDANE